MQQLAVTRSEVRKAQEQVNAMHAKQQEIDQLITERSKEYDFNRIGRVERTVLRLCSFELLFSTVPPKVAIAEAIRLRGSSPLRALEPAAHARQDHARAHAHAWRGSGPSGGQTDRRAGRRDRCVSAQHDPRAERSVSRVGHAGAAH